MVGCQFDDILDPLSNLRAECDALKDQALRSAAEAENTRRRLNVMSHRHVNMGIRHLLAIC